MQKVINSLRESLIVPSISVLLLWVIHGLLYFFHIETGDYGLTPRSASGLWGIITSPLVHANVEHLASNSLPLFVLSTGIIYFYRQTSVQSILLIYFLTQIFVWMFARGQAMGKDGISHTVTHLGISGVVYGLFAFVLGMGLFQRNIKSIILALLVITYYGSMIWGVLPFQASVSWESHLFGAIVGFLVSYAFRDIVEPDDEVTNGNAQSFRINKHVNIDKSNRPYFLPRYTFDGLREKYNAPPMPVFEAENEEQELNPPPDNTVTQQVYDEWIIMREKLRLTENWEDLENQPPNAEKPKDDVVVIINNDINKPVDKLESDPYFPDITSNPANNDKTPKGTPPNPNGWYTSNTTWDM